MREDAAPPGRHWYRVPGQELVIVVEDGDCSAAFSTGIGDEPRFDAKTAQRYAQLSQAAWATVKADGEYQALCQRLEALKAQHPNLRGCVAWIEHFPQDLCTEAYVPDPPPAEVAPGWSAARERIDHRCHWQFYVGEYMTTHTNRHFGLAVDPSRKRIEGAGLPMGTAIAGDTWRKGSQLRAALRAALASEAAVRKRCAGASDCPSVGGFSGLCAGDACFDVTLGEASWAVELDAASRPAKVYFGDETSTAYRDWLTAGLPASQ